MISSAWIATEEAGHDAEHAEFGTDRRRTVCRRIGEETAIGRVGLAVGAAFMRLQRRDIAVHAHHRRRHQCLAGMEAGVGNGVARVRIIGAIGDDIVALDQRGDVLSGCPGFKRLDSHIGIERCHLIGGTPRFRLTDIGGAIENLALQVRERDGVVIDDADTADTCRGAIGQNRHAEASGADDEEAGDLQTLLTGAADIGHHQMPRIALDFVRG